MKTYPSNLTDSQWEAILAILKDKRKRKYSLREISDVIFYFLKSGCQWRMLPLHFASWKLVHYYFTKWKYEGTFELIHEILRDKTRKKAGKETSSSVGIIDNQNTPFLRQKILLCLQIKIRPESS